VFVNTGLAYRLIMKTQNLLHGAKQNLKRNGREAGEGYKHKSSASRKTWGGLLSWGRSKKSGETLSSTNRTPTVPLGDWFQGNPIYGPSYHNMAPEGVRRQKLSPEIKPSHASSTLKPAHEQGLYLGNKKERGKIRSREVPEFTGKKKNSA